MSGEHTRGHARSELSYVGDSQYKHMANFGHTTNLSYDINSDPGRRSKHDQCHFKMETEGQFKKLN